MDKKDLMFGMFMTFIALISGLLIGLDAYDNEIEIYDDTVDTCKINHPDSCLDASFSQQPGSATLKFATLGIIEDVNVPGCTFLQRDFYNNRERVVSRYHFDCNWKPEHQYQIFQGNRHIGRVELV